MSSYFRWIKSGKRDDYFTPKPRSRSLDSKTLEASGIRLILQNVFPKVFFLYFLVSVTKKKKKNILIFVFLVSTILILLFSSLSLYFI